MCRDMCSRQRARKMYWLRTHYRGNNQLWEKIKRLKTITNTAPVAEINYEQLLYMDTNSV